MSVKILLRPFLFVFQLLNRIFWSGLNGRNVFRFVLTFWINFSPVFLWLMIFKNAGLIPNDIRPKIYVKFAMLTDDYMFTIGKFGSSISLITICVASWLIYIVFYRKESESSDTKYESLDLESFELDTMESTPEPLPQQDFQEDEHIKTLEFFDTLSSNTITTQCDSINERILNQIKLNGNKPINCWNLAPPILLASSWFILNLAYWCREPLYVQKDLLAWFSYVLLHFFAPLFTAIWLYVFHAPGSLKLFSFALGMQNISGVFTHLLFPNAPPWFIHLYGPDAEANYDLPGYAAGLTRVDLAMGTHMHSDGFHKSPIVFGALPSLHSAMAVMCFFFVSYYSRWTFLKIAALSFVVLQWWATIYLDHHWRLDLIAGLLYAITSFTLLYVWKGGFRRVDRNFVDARLRYDFRNGSTMGMRVFRNTKLQNFFDPLS